MRMAAQARPSRITSWSGHLVLPVPDSTSSLLSRVYTQNRRQKISNSRLTTFYCHRLAHDAYGGPRPIA